MRALSPLLLLSLCACAASGLTAFRSHAWKGALDADHPLVGVVWDVKAGVALDGPELDARLGAARFVMLGEKHDNPDHHTLQGALVRRIVLFAEHDETRGPEPGIELRPVEGDA
ncbi:MAG: hypothetical protein AAFU79_33535, partial [Myxococcota bacterium]